jgi:hypothetical protein
MNINRNARSGEFRVRGLADGTRVVDANPYQRHRMNPEELRAEDQRAILGAFGTLSASTDLGTVEPADKPKRMGTLIARRWRSL